MNWNKAIRVTHRWTSVVFIATVLVATYAAVSGQTEESVLYYLPLPPLFLQLITGTYLFVLPYVAKGRAGRTTI